MARTEWLDAVFARVDEQNIEAFLAHLTPDALFRYGSNAPLVGQRAIEAMLRQFYGTIRSCQHRVLRVWEGHENLVCQGEVTYLLPDGRSLVLPFCNVFELQGSRIARYEIYIDPTPIAEPGR